MKKEWLLPRAAVPVDMETIRMLIEEIKNMQERIDSLYDRYMQVCRQREELLDTQRSMVEAMRGRIQ
jgi:FtsZ-binding cell division protein ZapB